MQDKCFQVGDWAFSPLHHTLQDPRSGRCVELDLRTAQLLLFFVQHPGEVLTRDEMVAAVWNRSVVTDHAITQAIFELRRALRDNRLDAPVYIQTLPKRGYQLVVPVGELDAQTVCASAVTEAEPAPTLVTVETASVAVEAGSAAESLSAECEPVLPDPGVAPQLRLTPRARPNRFVAWTRWGGAFAALLLVFGSLYHLYGPASTATATATAAGNIVLRNPAGLIVSYTLTQDDQQDALLVGLGDFIVYKLNGLTRYDVSQVSHEAPEILDSSGRLIRLRLVQVGGAPFIQLSLINQITQKSMLDKRYPLADMTGSMVLMLEDLLKVLSDKTAAPELVDAVAWNYPSEPANAQRFFNGHYQFYKGDEAALRKAVVLLRELCKDAPARPILFAELGMSLLILGDMTEEPAWREEAQHLFAELDKLSGQPHLPPVVFEAQAMRALYGGDSGHARELVNRALSERDTWYGQVVRGKLAEVAGRTNEAADAYTRAYLLKPDQITLNWIARLAFPSDIRNVAPALARHHPS